MALYLTTTTGGAFEVRAITFSPRLIRSAALTIGTAPEIACDVTEVHNVKPKIQQQHVHCTVRIDNQLLHGLHDMTLSVVDVDGVASSVSQPFSLDGSKASVSFPALLLLRLDMEILVRIFVLLMIIPPLLLCLRPTACATFATRHLLRFAWPAWRTGVAASLSRVALGLSQSHLARWLAVILASSIIAPIFAARIVDDSIGFVFLYGAWARGVFIPSPFGFMHFTFSLLLGVYPLTVALAAQHLAADSISFLLAGLSSAWQARTISVLVRSYGWLSCVGLDTAILLLEVLMILTIVKKRSIIARAVLLTVWIPLIAFGFFW
jgi:hypothetical protein